MMVRLSCRTSLFTRQGRHLGQRGRQPIFALRPQNQAALGQDEGRHAGNVHVLPALLQSPNRGRKALVFQHSFGLGAIKACGFDCRQQHIAVAHIVAAAEIGIEQGKLQRRLPARILGPVQQLVGIEAVVDTAARRAIETNAQWLGDGCHLAAIGGRLFGRCAIFITNMLYHILAFRAHAGVQLERVPADIGLKPGDLQRLFQLPVTDVAPWANDVGNDVDLYSVCHGAAPLIEAGAYSR